MERTFLVLRENVALARIKARDAARGGHPGHGGDPQPAAHPQQHPQPQHMPVVPMLPPPPIPVPAPVTVHVPVPASPHVLPPRLDLTSTPALAPSSNPPLRLTPIVHPMSGAVSQTGNLKLVHKLAEARPKDSKSKEGKDPKLKDMRQKGSKGTKREPSPDAGAKPSKKR